VTSSDDTCGYEGFGGGVSVVDGSTAMAPPWPQAASGQGWRGQLASDYERMEVEARGKPEEMR
jgi:hypothetical protein